MSKISRFFFSGELGMQSAKFNTPHQPLPTHGEVLQLPGSSWDNKRRIEKILEDLLGDFRPPIYDFAGAGLQASRPA
jgi:hypothetical protein